MSNKTRKQKAWNIVLFSGAKSPINNFKVTKLFLIYIFMFTSLIVLAMISYIFLLFYEKELEQQALYEEINIRDRKVAEVQSEVDEVKREYRTLRKRL
ncbi:hypothetical protein J2S74_005381 [Evansella vedderi]|uniref:Uncharacterized protein n=1 Tax=Evansella vedderi TaxID=38282 RepID=A0ABU0A5E2_9BACI|nr:hypothetical protein [Evansella vedderi]MDQ0257918.1 hypothetical protein [Evansella vedderi]